MIIIQNQPINMVPQSMHTVSAEGLNLQPEEAQVYPPPNNYALIRDALLRLGIRATYRAIQSDNFVEDVSGWKLAADGVGYLAEGNIGGWNINATTIYSDGNEIILDSANKKIESGNYVSGVNGAGFHLSEDLLEVANISARGLIRTAVFQKDVISSVGGNFMVIDSDMLNVDMTALDASTLTTKATTTFSVGDFLRIKDGTDDEWFEVTAVNGSVYTVTRDKNSDYAADTNPAWKKGATVVNYGQSGDGGIFMTASESNAPYLSVFTHAGSPWTDLTTRLRIGNLNGYLGYTTDKYGIGIGDTDNYLKFDPTNKLQIKVSGANALHIEHGSDILLTHGGDIKFTSVTAPTACTAVLIETAGNIDAGTHKYKITFLNATGETSLGSVSNTVTNDGTHEQNSLTSIPISSSGSVTSRKIYRTKVGDNSYYLLTTIADNTTTTYTDNTADVSLGLEKSVYGQNDTFGKFLIDDIVAISAGQINSSFGRMAGQDNTTGYLNTFVGGQSGRKNTTGNFNTFIGWSSGYKNVGGGANTFLGGEAGYTNVSGYSNTYLGYYSGYYSTGNNNTFIGQGSGLNATGSNNVFLGYQAGYDETGSDKLFIDNQDRGSEVNGRTKSLIYGIFNSVVADQSLRLNASVGINTADFGSGKVVLAIANATTVPSANPTGGGVIYCEGGALKYRGSSGTITTIANA